MNLFYPAVLVATLSLGIKAMAIVVHTTTVKQLSVGASASEGSFEASFQLLFMLIIWMTGGRRELTAMLSSLVMVAKTRVETFLTSPPVNRMEGKTCWQRVVLVVTLLPAFLVTTVFRLGSLAILFTSLPAELKKTINRVLESEVKYDKFLLFCCIFCFVLVVWFGLFNLRINFVSFVTLSNTLSNTDPYF